MKRRLAVLFVLVFAIFLISGEIFASADRPIIKDFPPDVQKKFEEKRGKLAEDGTLIPVWDVPVQKPDSSIPDNCANFLGVWSGRWVDQYRYLRTPHRVTIYSVKPLSSDSCSIQMYVSEGADPNKVETYIPTFWHWIGKIEGNKLVPYGSKWPFEYIWKMKDGKPVLEVTARNHAIPSWAILSKINE